MTAYQVLPHLPHLRRFARLLTGEQGAGDALVEALLRRLIDEPQPRPADGDGLRVWLYRMLLEGLQPHAPRIGRQNPDRTAEQRLMTLGMDNRLAFLLANVEEFSLNEAAEILRISPGEVAERLDEAGREIARQMATTVLIIEDEPMIALSLEMLMTEMGHTVVGTAATKEDALQLFERAPGPVPGLVLADIQLADGSSGLDAARDILNTSLSHVIFITAFPERLLTGAQPEPAFLITKPFQPDEVKAVVSQVLFFRPPSRIKRQHLTARDVSQATE